MQKKLKKNHYNSGLWNGKHYNFFGDYLWKKYQHRVLKLPINAGLSCPNRDGSLSKAGCVFCSDDGSASPTTTGHFSIKSQIKNAIQSFNRSDRETKYIAYFQAYTNTYASVKKLEELYDEAISYPDIMGLMIGTRPDCINEEIASLISSYKKNDFELWLELGMQSMHNKSLKLINRHHTHQDTIKAVQLAAQYSIPVCLHIILGIPNESWTDMMASAELIATLPVQGVKLHHLHVIKNTPLEKLYNQNKIKLLSFADYTSIVCDFMERLPADILIHRLSGDREEKSLIAPRWGLHKGTVLNAIEDQFIKRGTWQGFFLENSL